MQKKIEEARIVEIERSNKEYMQFIEQLNAGTITDVSPYLKPERHGYRAELIRHGLFVDECIAVAVERDEAYVIQTAISRGYGQTYYETWAKHSDWTVRESLAFKGYFPELFIHDLVCNVRKSVLVVYPHYARYLLDTQSTDELDDVTKIYQAAKEPNFDELERLLANPLLSQDMQFYCVRNDLQNKFATRHIQLSTIEKTMSAAQLFMIKSEGWKRSVNAIQLRELTRYEEQLRNHPDCEEILTKYLQNDNHCALEHLRNYISCEEILAQLKFD